MAEAARTGDTARIWTSAFILFHRFLAGPTGQGASHDRWPIVQFLIPSMAASAHVLVCGGRDRHFTAARAGPLNDVACAGERVAGVLGPGRIA